MEQANVEQKKRLGFGGRGWILIAVSFTAFFLYALVSNYPLNILASDFLGGSQRVAVFMTIGTIIGLVIQLIFSRFIGKIQSIRNITIWVGLIAVVLAWLVAALPLVNLVLWYVVYTLSIVTSTVYALFFLELLVGQWFPRRKGTVIGIATISFPVCNAMIGFFANSVYKPFEMGIMVPAIFKSFVPYLIVCTIGLVLFVIFIKDYPEQCGAYRDNDRSFTKEQAQAMMEQEIEDKKTTVWTPKHIFKVRDFWFAAIPCGLMLMCVTGVVTQSSTIIGYFPQLNYTVVMMIIAACGAFGSWFLGYLDTRIGTKTSLRIATCLMILAGIFGMISTFAGIAAFEVVALILVGLFMGASSNYNVSISVQYWRREDFQGVYACVNPIANVFNAIAPTIVAALLFTAAGVNVSNVFIMVLIAGIVALILIILFSNKHVKEIDDKYRSEAGKPLDDELAKRK